MKGKKFIQLNLCKNDKFKELLTKDQIFLLLHKDSSTKNIRNIKNVKKNSFYVDKAKAKSPKALNSQYLNDNLFKRNKTKKPNDIGLMSSYSFYKGSFSQKNNRTKYTKNKSLYDGSTGNKMNSTKNNFTNITNSLMEIKYLSPKINKNNQHKKDEQKYFVFTNKMKPKNNSGRNKNTKNKQNNQNNPNSLNVNSVKNISKKSANKQSLDRKVFEYFEKKLIKNEEKVGKLFKNKLNKNYFIYINKLINKSKERGSMSLIDKLYTKLTQKSIGDINSTKEQSIKKSLSYPYFYIFQNYYNNNNNDIKNYLISENDLMTSWSLNDSVQEDLGAEEVHFLSVKYCQEIKERNNLFL